MTWQDIFTEDRSFIVQHIAVLLEAWVIYIVVIHFRQRNEDVGKVQRGSMVMGGGLSVPAPKRVNEFVIALIAAYLAWAMELYQLITMWVIRLA